MSVGQSGPKLASPGATGEITLTERPEVLSRMRRLGMLVEDEKRGEEYYETTFSAIPVRFYVGYAATLPLDWCRALYGADGYGNGSWMPMDEGCKNCKEHGKIYKKDVAGTGSTASGECRTCKGTGWVDTGKRYRLYKLLTQNDPLDFDSSTIPQRKMEAEKVNS